MTLHYPETDAAPTTFGGQPRNTLNTPYAGETAAEQTLATDSYSDTHGLAQEGDIVPIYARKPAKKKVAGVPKAALMAIPVVLALGVGAWALTAGEASRTAEPAAVEDTDSLTTSRLASTEPVSPEVTAPAVTETPAPATAAPLRAAAPVAAPVARSTRSSAPAPAARRVAAPARRASAPVADPVVPVAPQPYNSGALTTVITEPTPAPTAVAPTPVLPVEPPATETPPATSTPPGGQN